MRGNGWSRAVGSSPDVDPVESHGSHPLAPTPSACATAEGAGRWLSLFTLIKDNVNGLGIVGMCYLTSLEVLDWRKDK